MNLPVGSRVGAILDLHDGKARFFGYGILIDEEVPHGAGGMGSLLAEIGVRNPTILLESGEKVFGCECWWASEERVRKMLEGTTITMVSPRDSRSVDPAAPSVEGNHET